MHEHSDSLLADFQRDGFVVVRQFLRGQQLDDLQAHLKRFREHVVPRLPRAHVFYEDKQDPATLKQIQQLAEHDDYFRECFESGPFRELAEVLLEGPVLPRNLQYFNKPPGVGRATPAHQDGYYFMLDPCEAVTMWLALDKVDEENGCVRYAAGSHRRGLRPHGRTETLGFSQGITDYSDSDREREIPMPAEPGDLLAHHALTIHRADGNASAQRSRQALGFVYYSNRAQVDAEAHRAYQLQLQQDLIEADRI